MHKLAVIRQAQKLSRAKLGRMAGCSGQNIGRIEQEIQGVEPLLAVRIANVLQVPVLDLWPELAPLIEELNRTRVG